MLSNFIVLIILMLAGVYFLVVGLKAIKDRKIIFKVWGHELPLIFIPALIGTETHIGEHAIKWGRIYVALGIFLIIVLPLIYLGFL